MMAPYGNSAGNSGVVAYEIGASRITVQFVGGDRYVYTYASAGRNNIEQMKLLARRGKGLSTFISQIVKDDYDHKVS